MSHPALDGYSQNIANALFERWPEWKPLLRVETKLNRSTGYLYLELAPVSPRIEKGLYVMTDKDVIVGFDYYHSHLDGAGENNVSLGKWTVELIESILSDQILAVSWWKDGHMISANCAETGFPIEKSQFVQGEAKCRVRSWSGRHDQDSNQT